MPSPVSEIALETPAALDGANPEVRAQFDRLYARLAKDVGSVEALGALAESLHAYGLVEEAIPLYRHLAQREPLAPRWTHLLGVAEADVGLIDSATASFERTLEVAPQSLPTLVRLAALLADRGAEAESITLLDRVLVVAPQHARALYLRGLVAMRQGDWRGAAERFEAALASEPAAKKIHYPLAIALRRQGMVERADALLGQRNAVEPRWQDPWWQEVQARNRSARGELGRGTAYFENGAYREAEEAFRQAVAVDPRSASGWANLGAALTQLGRPEEAVDALETAVDLDPADAEHHFNLGSALARAGATDRAAEAYRVALELDPEHWPARYNLAVALERSGQFLAALDAFDRAVAGDPSHELARLGRASCRLALGVDPAARDQLEADLIDLPQSLLLQNALAQLLATSNQPEVRNGPRAERLARSLLAAERSTRHAATLAMALAEVGRFEEAIEWQRGAVRAAAGRRDLAARLQRDLEQYERSEPLRGIDLVGRQ